MPEKPLPNADDDEVKRIFTRLQSQLEDIEAAEIITGQTQDTLEEKGFIGKKSIEIERTRHQETTEKEKLSFAPGIDYKRLEDGAKFGDIDIETLEYLIDVKKGQTIATRASNETIPFDAADNVLKKTENDTIRFYAAVNGKVLIIRDKLYVFPSYIDCRIAIRVAPDRMSAFMDCAPSYGDGKPLTGELVLLELQKAGVIWGVQQAKIEETVTVVNQTRVKQTDVPVALGKAPIKGREGEVNFTFNTDESKQEFKILPDGRIDYKNSVNILMAHKGDLLATISDPGKGVSGIDVMGKALEAENGKAALLTAGQGVKPSPDGKSFYAETGGNIIHNGAVLEILEIYVVNSDVDYATGNINFNGNILINGDVKEGFEVKATGDITVMKNVESSRLESGRDIKIKGGVVAKGKGIVSAGRDITVEYVQNARLEAQGNILINNFAVNSYIFTSRFLKVMNKRGTVLGGEVYAQKGIEVKVLGTESGKKTLVEVGTDFLVRKKIHELEEAEKFIESNLQKIETALKPLFLLYKTQPAALGNKTEIVKKTIEKKKEMDLQKRTMLAKLEELSARLNERETCFVKVSGICYQDVQIKIKELKTYVTKAVEHKTFYEDRKEGEIKTSAYS